MSDGVNPFAYILPALALGAALLYYAYGAVDRMGLETHDAQALVTAKNYAPGTTTHNTNIVAGRAWTQSHQNPDSYVVGLDIDGDITTIGLVTKEIYDSLGTGDRVRVKYRRTRFSNQVLVTDVSR